MVLRKVPLGLHEAYHFGAYHETVYSMKPIGSNSPDLILRSIAQAMRLEGWRLAPPSPAAILRDASLCPSGEGLLPRMRSGSLETLGLTESIHQARPVRIVFEGMS